MQIPRVDFFIMKWQSMQEEFNSRQCWFIVWLKLNYEYLLDETTFDEMSSVQF